MQVQALVLAGGENNGRLRDYTPETSEALIKIGDRIMVDYVIQVLRSCPEVERIVVAGPLKDLEQYYIDCSDLLFAPSGNSPMGSVQQGMHLMDPAQMMLVVTGDIPLLSPEAVQDFVNRCEPGTADLYYPIVRKEINEEKYPGVERTYIQLKEGIFTGGNMFLVRPQVVEGCFEKAEELVKLRKSPLALSRQIGLTFILKLLLHRLTIKEVEGRFSSLLGLAGRAVETYYPEIGIDVDKPSDLELVRKVLAS